MNRDEILKTNKHYWDTYADLWLGTTALPICGVHFVTESELHLFGDVSGKKMLESNTQILIQFSDSLAA